MSWQQVKEAFQYKEPDETRKFKRCGVYHIVELMKKDQDEDNVRTNEHRDNVKDARFAKFRANFLFVVNILDLTTMQFVPEWEHTWISGAHHWISQAITYRKNEFAVPHQYEPNPNKVCAPGIHFFKSLEAAFFYVDIWSPFIHSDQRDLSFDEDGIVSLCQNKEKEMINELNRNFTTQILCWEKKYHLHFFYQIDD
jgi:hypothetical protein